MAFYAGLPIYLEYIQEIIPINRTNPGLGTIKRILKYIKNNYALVMFPEGTRNGMAKGIKPKNGAVLIAATAGKPIIPIGIQGSFKPFTKVIVNIGKPIDYSKLKEEVKDKEQASELTKDLMKEIVHLRDQNVKQLKKNQTKNLT